MMQTQRTLPIAYQGNHSYDIRLTDSLDSFHPLLRALALTEKRLCIVSDSNVASLYLEQTKKYLFRMGCPSVYSYVFPAGEENKTLAVIQNIYEFLIQNHFDRSDVLIALGGGVTGDMTGYAAATYLRGIRFIQIPTSLLAMVDSSIGGKTGVDFNGYKNMVGAFHQPSLVYVNTTFLSSLDKRQFSSGMGEILKHGLICNKNYFHWLALHSGQILSLEPEAVTSMIYESQVIKKNIVESDPKEKGERAYLNFGHTIGHAIEKTLNFTLLHGECVALGMVAASFISHLRGHLSKEDLHLIEDTISLYGLPMRFKALDTAAILESCSHDKKKDGARIKFILLASIGECFLTTDVTSEEMTLAVEYLKEGID